MLQPMPKTKKINGDRPVTQDDLSVLAGEMTRRFDSMQSDIASLKTDVTALKTDVASLKSGQQAILNVVQDIDQQLKEWKHIPKKVERLHKHVFPHG